MGLRTRAEKTCKVCGGRFAAWSADRQLNRICSPDCALKFARDRQTQERKKQARKDLRDYNERNKSLAKCRAEAQSAVNEYIRVRDHGKPCVSCGTTKDVEHLTGGYWHAGHYRSRGAAPHLSLVLVNIWKQCPRCNKELSGNTVPYRQELVRRIGEARVLELEADNTPRKYARDQLSRIRRIFQKRAYHYRKRRGL